MHRKFLCLTLTLCVAVVTHAQTDKPPVVYNMGEVDVTVPADVKVERNTRIDFTLFSFTTGTKPNARQMLFAYMGYYPGFPSEGTPKSVRRMSEYVNKSPAKTFRWNDKSGYYRESLISIRVINPVHAPNRIYIHAVYSKLTESESKTADAMINFLCVASKKGTSASVKP